MNLLKLTFSIFILSVFFAGSIESIKAQENSGTPVQSSVASSYDNGYSGFLERVGFENFSQRLRQSIKDKNFLDPNISEKVLVYQSDRLEMYNDVRDLAVEVLNTLHTNNRSPVSRDKIIEFAARLLNMKPIAPDLPERYENDPDAATIHLMERTRDNIEVQSEVMMSDLITVLYGKNRIQFVLDQLEKNSNYDQLDEISRVEVIRLAELQKKVNRLVQFMYLDNEMGGYSVSALGKALVLGLTRYQILKEKSGGKVNKDTDLIEKMKAKLESFKLHYENYVGTELVIDGEDGKKQIMKINNGDDIFERSYGQQANEITAGSRPGGLQNWLKAAELGLLGSIAGRNLHNENGEVEDKPKLSDRLNKKLRESKMFTNGVSHAGIAEVLVDPETGIETTRSWDAYLDDLEGGMRVTDILHQFARKSEYLRLISYYPDAEKFARYAQEYAKKTGYKETIWMGDKENKNGTIHKEDSVPWKAHITEEEFKQLITLAQNNPTAFSKEIRRRVVLGMQDLFYKGTGFASGFNNSFGRAYCSFAIYLAYMQRTNIDPQPVHDRWNYLVQVAKKMEVEKLEKYNMERRLISPVGLITQAKIFSDENYQEVTYGKLSEESRLRESFAKAVETAMDTNIHRRLRTIGQFVKGTQPGAEHAAHETLLITRIEDAFAIERNYNKIGKRDHHHGDNLSSYMRRVNSLIRRAHKRAAQKSASSENSNRQDNLSCSNVFKK